MACQLCDLLRELSKIGHRSIEIGVSSREAAYMATGRPVNTGEP